LRFPGFAEKHVPRQAQPYRVRNRKKNKKGETTLKRKKWSLALSTTILTAVAIASSSLPKTAVGAESNSIPAPEVKIDNFNFGPDLTISAGTTVTWTNQDDVPHVVASDSNIFKSKALDTNDHFSYTFAKPGTYVYYCTVHPRMTAKVIVQ
jgi:plastocyanin